MNWALKLQERLTLEDNKRKVFFKKIEVARITNEQKNPVKNIVHIQSSMEKLILC